MNHDTKRIRIDHVQGGGTRDQQALMRNYFMTTGVNNTFQFFTPNGELIPTTPVVVATGFDFSFFLREMPGVTWTIRKFDVNDDRAGGDWTNTQQVEAEEGTFTAQAGGGTGEDETASSASA